jgi:hypothetical protein
MKGKTAGQDKVKGIKDKQNKEEFGVLWFQAFRFGLCVPNDAHKDTLQFAGFFFHAG